jgi:hypothetical protein
VPFPLLLSTLIRSWFQAKPATLLIPIDFSLFPFAVEELYGTWYQSGSFFLIPVGSGFHCLRSFFLSFLLWGLSELVRLLYMLVSVCGGGTRFMFGGESVHMRKDRGMFFWGGCAYSKDFEVHAVLRRSKCTQPTPLAQLMWNAYLNAHFRP